VVEAASGGVVGLGATVELEDAETGRRSTYEIVAAHEASPSQGRLSNESPVATALRGRKAGEEATVTTPRGERRMRVVAVR
jgi:transcription elongation factor GreA